MLRVKAVRERVAHDRIGKASRMPGVCQGKKSLPPACNFKNRLRHKFLIEAAEQPHHLRG